VTTTFCALFDTLSLELWLLLPEGLEAILWKAGERPRTSTPRKYVKWCVILTSGQPFKLTCRPQMFVFGEVQDPNQETVNLVEDIVRSQLIELVRPLTVSEPLLMTLQILQARALATKRGARYVSAEDLIFLIRHDRGKVNRLRTYLSWKDVRKHAKDSGGDGGGGVEEALDEGDGTQLMTVHGMLLTRTLDKLAAKAQKITIKLSWEIPAIYSEVLRQSGHQSDDEEDEDDIEAHEASIQRLKVRLNLVPSS